MGVGAIIFNDLSNNRIKDIDFNWDEALSFEGNTGPYVQYTHARCAGILDKASRELDLTAIRLTDDYEKALVKVLNIFPEKITQAREELEPSVISRYLLDVCQCFNRFYQNCPVLKAQDDVTVNTRLALVNATRNVLNRGLRLIGLKTPNNI